MAAIAALTDNYIWAINNPKHQCALMVDPGDAKPVIAYLEQHQLKLKGILITHHHWDHVNGVADLIQYCPVPVYGPKQSQFSELTQRLDEGEHGFIHDYFPNFQVLSIPGHTLDHIAYYADNSLFCGDTLFAGGCGRLFEGTPEQLYTSLQKIAALPDTTKLYCAHEYTQSNGRYALVAEPDNADIARRMDDVNTARARGEPTVPTTIALERATNPFMRANSVEQLAERRSAKDVF